MENKKKIILCSACLLGINCKFDGNSNKNKKVLKLRGKAILIPVCPEVLGGLGIPREWAEIKGKKVLTKSRKDVTRNYKRGAKEVLKIAKLLNAKVAILKQKSPACGVGFIYDGSFSGKIKKGDGICTRLLKKHKIKVFSEKDKNLEKIKII